MIFVPNFHTRYKIHGYNITGFASNQWWFRKQPVIGVYSQTKITEWWLKIGHSFDKYLWRKLLYWGGRSQVTTLLNVICLTGIFQGFFFRFRNTSSTWHSQCLLAYFISIFYFSRFLTTARILNISKFTETKLRMRSIFYSANTLALPYLPSRQLLV